MRIARLAPEQYRKSDRERNQQCIGGLDTYLSARLRAQNVLEYGLLMVTIAVIVLLGVNGFGHPIEPWFASLTHLVTTHT